MRLEMCSGQDFRRGKGDDALYAVQVTDLVSKTPTTTLFFGPVSGGNPTSFAFANTNAGTVTTPHS